MVKVLCLFLRHQIPIFFVLHLEQMLCHGGSRSASNNFWKIVDDFLKILDHGDYHSSILDLVHVHNQVLMYLTPSCFGPVTKYPTYPVTEICDVILLNVGYLQIIYVPTHGHLGSIYQFIGHTWVIWVHF